MFSIVTATTKLTPDDLAPVLATYDALASEELAFELVVQDMGSSQAALAALASRSYVRLVSGSDTGIYDAWNQALRRVSGDWVGFLGIDDHPTRAWVAFVSRYAPPEGLSVLACDVNIVDPISRRTLGVFANPRSGTLDSRANAFSHPGLAVARHAFEGRRFNDRYRIIGDLVFYAQLPPIPVVGHLGHIGVAMELGGNSNSPRGSRRVLREYVRAVRLGEAPLHPPLLARRLVAACLSFVPGLYLASQRARWKLAVRATLPDDRPWLGGP